MRLLFAIAAVLLLVFLWVRQGGRQKVVLPDGTVVEPQVVDIQRQAEAGGLDVPTYERLREAGVSGVAARTAATPGTDANRKLLESVALSQVGAAARVALNISKLYTGRKQSDVPQI